AEKKFNEENPKKAAADKALADAEPQAKATADARVVAEKAAADALAESQKLADQISTTLTGYTGTVWAVAFSPDGKRLATGGHRDSIKLWDLAAKKEIFPKPPKKEEPTAA